MPAGSEIERRDRALIAFTILTGVRDGAMASLKLKHVDIEEGQVDQDARDVNTKFSKTFVTILLTKRAYEPLSGSARRPSTLR